MNKAIGVTGKGAKWLAAAGGIVAGIYAANAARTWLTFGRASLHRSGEQDRLLHRFMPGYDVCEFHQAHIEASPETVFAAAKNMDINESAISREIFRLRQWFMKGAEVPEHVPRGIVEEVTKLGWVVLAENGKEIVLGSVTRPWQANVVFRGIRPGEFLEFSEPNFVKIVWNLKAEPSDRGGSVFTTETRALATDASARRKLRIYWSLVSPGVWLVRRLAIAPLKRRAELQEKANSIAA